MTSQPAPLPATRTRKPFPVPLAVFLLLAAGIAAASWYFYRGRERIAKADIQAELSAIADLKAEQIIRWRAERLADAEVLRTDPFLDMMFEQHLRLTVDSVPKFHLQQMLSKIVAIQGYRSAALVDTDGNIRFSTRDGHAVCRDTASTAIFRDAIAQKHIAMTDLHTNGGGGDNIHLTIFAPVMGARDKPAAGAIVLDIDPESFLFPLIQSWPTPSKTAEVLLIRQDGDSVLYLNELRHRKSTALRLRLPMRPDLPAARAIAGFHGVMEGADYRSVPVLAAARGIPGTTWFMIAKIDRDEAIAPIRNIVRRAIALTLLLVLLAGVAIALYQRHRTSRIYKKLYIAEREKNDLTASLASSEERFYRLFSSMTEGVALHDVIFDGDGKPVDYRILSVNPAYEKHTGLSPDNAAGVLASELYRTGTPPYLEEFTSVGITGKPIFFETFFPPLNKHFAISVFSPEKNRFATVFEDITSRKLAEKERESTLELLRLLNAKNNNHDLMRSVTGFLQSWSGCEAIGIRLKDGDDYPYYETRGFPQEFVALENSLCAKDLRGQLLRDDIGNPVIECMCGNVICGRFDPSKPFFTRRGSFWSNCTTLLLASTTDADRQTRTRNRCNGEGYESVALIRLKFGETPLGLIQINDKRQDRFTLPFIEQVERFADSISIAHEQRRTQALLADERQRLLVTLRSIGDGVIATDTGGRVMLMNSVAEELTGWTLKDASGRPLTEVFRIVNERTRAPCENPVEKVLATGGIVGLADHTALIRKDGSERSIADSGAPIRDAAAKTIGVVLVFRDESEKRRAEEQLRESEERFRRIFDQSSVGMALSDKRNIFVAVNPAFCTMLGYTARELLDLTFKDITHPEHLGSDKTAVEKLIRGEIPVYKTDKRYITKSGAVIYGSLVLSSLRDSAGAHQHSLVLLENITDKKLAEAALIAEKERLAVTLRSIGDAVIATDIHGRIVLMNRVAETLTGWPLAEAEGRPLAEVFVIINELTRQRCENPVEKVLKTGAIVTLENHTVLISRDGRETVVADSGAPIRDRDSVIIGVVLVFRDDSEKQRARDAMRKAEQLESLGVLAGGIAHDFNNLLSGLFGYLDLARDSIRSDHDAARNLDKAFSVFGRAKDLTGQLLTFAKGGAPARTTKALAPLINDTVRFALSGSVVKPVFEISPDLAACDIDENQVGQVLDNIIINARDAMPRGGAITVSAANLPADAALPPVLRPGRYIRISISDQGTGIAPDHLPHIFDPFFTTKQKGSGLGLAVSYSIVKRHDGAIEVESELGKGTTFHIYLPVSAKAAAPDLTDKVSFIHKGSGRVLIMDDEEYIRDIASSMLQSMGYETASATCGEEAIEMFAEAQKLGKPYRLVILDLTVPGGMGGKETKDCLRKLTPAAAIIASSGYSDDPVIASPQDHGFDASVKKPYKKAELAEAVAGVMRGKKV